MKLIDRLRNLRADLAVGREVRDPHLDGIRVAAADEIRPGFLARAVGVDVALIVQLILIVIELVKQVRELRRR